MTGPTLKQLLALVNRAERGVLLAGEAVILRDALTALDAARRSAGGLQAALHTERARVARVRELHQPAPCGNARCKEGQWCFGCDPDRATCADAPWPCPTITALDGRQEPAGAPGSAPDALSPTEAATHATRPAGDPR
ncbi:hypothetical protein [Streptomyces sp. NPDC088733]|uniref:hypothetical protein n=1 Tax=Streptomyces sp. NPDC088733 TaxID=3365880 RepID=UPI00381D24F9